MKLLPACILVISLFQTLSAQNSDSTIISQIYSNALTSRQSYANLVEICEKAPGRLVGSHASEEAIRLFARQLKDAGADTVYRQEYYAGSWQCLGTAKVVAMGKAGADTLHAVALGPSVGTPEDGIQAKVIEVYSPESLDSLDPALIKDKIVFFNKPMNNSFLMTGRAYGDAISQRIWGASKASEYGARAVLIRSLGIEIDDYPHTGVTIYKEGVRKIPALALSTYDAEKLSALLREQPRTEVWMHLTTITHDSVLTCNLVAEIRGTTEPEKVILVGGHMDSWHNTAGAHDDAAGCVQSIDVLRIFRELDIRPRHTLRAVLFMDEEISQTGAKEYARIVGVEGTPHLLAIESDAGGFLPLGFSVQANDTVVARLAELGGVLKEYGIYTIAKGHSGVDIEPLAQYGIPLIGLNTNGQRYFEIHHAAFDTPEMVGRREMQLGTAGMASLIFLIDTYGVE
ncbi:MAG: M20/M25/M40 family metallo-hydrolase [Bacteroidales bacterium]|nr:M20/M25/M40 family metallo-hydrolase [Bacteroidales bacterium]